MVVRRLLLHFLDLLVRLPCPLVEGPLHVSDLRDLRLQQLQPRGHVSAQLSAHLGGRLLELFQALSVLGLDLPELLERVRGAFARDLEPGDRLLDLDSGLLPVALEPLDHPRALLLLRLRKVCAELVDRHLHLLGDRASALHDLAIEALQGYPNRLAAPADNLDNRVELDIRGSVFDVVDDLLDLLQQVDTPGVREGSQELLTHGGCGHGQLVPHLTAEMCHVPRHAELEHV
mmetsp:Transcript_38659/g.111664  ORF Transcript_38659/g.111664 Transcript_38659/m.111664 type:complete len:232 (+) Transcript_38659:2027-2722(+)